MTEPVEPHDLHAEVATLGAVLLNPALLTQAALLVRPEDFYRHAHRLIWEACLALDHVGTPIDLATLARELQTRGHLDAVGGRAYLAKLVDGVPRVSNIGVYAEIVRDMADRRRALEVTQAATAAIRQGEDLLDVSSALEERLWSLHERRTAGLRHITQHQAVGSWAVRAAAERQPVAQGIPTGFPKLDDLMGGLHRSDLILLAARTSQGKTALALQIAAFVAEERPVALFSLEMSATQLLHRLLAAEAQVDSHRFRIGRLAPIEADAVKRAWDRVQRLSLWIDDTPNRSLAAIRTSCLGLTRHAGLPLGLIVVDYLQLVAPPARTRRYDSRVQEVSAISAGLKAMAKDLDAPVLALSQLSRAADQRAGRPRLSDLRESGSLEQDADVVLLLWRQPDQPAMAHVMLAKHRNGPVGTIRLWFRSESTRFGTPDESAVPPPTDREADPDDDDE
jgi:replicative DNA helicase